jgi:hypothetical protein
MMPDTISADTLRFESGASSIAGLLVHSHLTRRQRR